MPSGADQKTSTESDAPRYDAGQEHSHKNLDSKDQRSIANRLASAESAESESSNTVTDPLKAARDHGNEPSRGAKVDAELQAADEAELRNKGHN
ncbi:hypothetical protein PLICRDRAFT_87543 [Plicaturopsis crispa FD-325 SS-3]|nr:hypothetical protein PLICRDRAFT_87543 [Plicaturopsis crispa FD-325 SS-3]